MSRPKLLIIGRSGQLAHALQEEAATDEISTVAWGRPEIDVTRPESISRALDRAAPELVVNASAYTAVDRAESEPESASLVNETGVGNLAEACRRNGVPLVHISTDFVFDGEKRTPYKETDAVAPLNAYGRSKAAGEERLRAALDRHVILRTSWVYGTHGANFVKTMLRLGAERPELDVVADQYGCPTSAKDLARAILAIAPRLVSSDAAAPWGTYHLAGSGETTWYGLASAVFRRAADRGCRVPTLRPIATADYPVAARRPAYSVLDSALFVSTFGIRLPDWQDSLDVCISGLLPPEEQRQSA